jgi:hypothetical protein
MLLVGQVNPDFFFFLKKKLKQLGLKKSGFFQPWVSGLTRQAGSVQNYSRN